MKWLIAQIFGNLGYVGNGVWRSAQRWYLYPILMFLKLKTIINLATRPEEDLQDRFEKWFCKKLNIRYVTFPNISPDLNFLDAFNELCNCDKPCICHCEGGHDRTGGLIAYYRRKVLKDDWHEIIGDWSKYGILGENWLVFLFSSIC